MVVVVCVVGILTKTESLNLLGAEMNALELADELDNMLKAIGLTDNRVPTMLRQQQAEIKDLKQQVAFLEDWRNTWSPFLKAIMGKAQEK
jgi:hypothetical protein